MADLGDLGTNVMTCDTQVLICLSRCECWWWQFHSRGYRGHGCLGFLWLRRLLSAKGSPCCLRGSDPHQGIRVLTVGLIFSHQPGELLTPRRLGCPPGEQGRCFVNSGHAADRLSQATLSPCTSSVWLIQKASRTQERTRGHPRLDVLTVSDSPFPRRGSRYGPGSFLSLPPFSREKRVAAWP